MFKLICYFSVCLGFALVFNQNLYSMVVGSRDSFVETSIGYKESYSKYTPIDVVDKTEFKRDYIVETFFLRGSPVHYYNSYQRKNYSLKQGALELVYEQGLLIKDILEFEEQKSGYSKKNPQINLVKTDSTARFYPKVKEYPYTIVQWNKEYMKNFLFLNFLDEIAKLYSTSVSWCPYKKNRLLPVIRWFVDNSGDFSYGGGLKFAVESVAVEVYDSLQTMMSLKTYEQGTTLLGYIGYSWILSLNLHRSSPRDFYGNFDYSLTPTVTYMYMNGTLMFSPYISVTYTQRYMSLETEKYYSLGLYAEI